MSPPYAHTQLELRTDKATQNAPTFARSEVDIRLKVREMTLLERSVHRSNMSLFILLGVTITIADLRHRYRRNTSTLSA